MKKIFKFVLTISFTAISTLAINSLISDFSNQRLLFIVVAFTFFLMFLFAWIAPKVFFDMCWKITKIMPDNFDYDTNLNKLDLASVVMLVTANVVSIIGFLTT